MQGGRRREGQRKKENSGAGVTDDPTSSANHIVCKGEFQWGPIIQDTFDELISTQTPKGGGGLVAQDDMW